MTLSSELLGTVCSGFLKLGAHRSENVLLHHVLVERAEGRVILAMTDLSTALIYCHLPEALPLTELQRKLVSARWRAEAVRFLVPLADLREASRVARGVVKILPSELRCGPLALARSATPDVAEFPRILPPLDTFARRLDAPCDSHRSHRSHRARCLRGRLKANLRRPYGYGKLNVFSRRCAPGPCLAILPPHPRNR